MKKLILAFFLVLFTFNIVCAQNKKSSSDDYFSLGAELSLPIGLFGDVYSFGIGASAKENFAIADNTALTIYVGYVNYFLKSTYGSGNQGYVPVLGGVEFNFSPAVFGSSQLGITFYTEGGGSAFTYSPGVGFRLGRNFTALLKYVGEAKSAINSSSIGIRAAYTFGK